MVIFRQDIIDRFVLKLLNRHMIVPEDLDISERGCFCLKRPIRNGLSFMKVI